MSRIFVVIGKCNNDPGYHVVVGLGATRPQAESLAQEWLAFPDRGGYIEEWETGEGKAPVTIPVSVTSFGNPEGKVKWWKLGTYL